MRTNSINFSATTNTEVSDNEMMKVASPEYDKTVMMTEPDKSMFGTDTAKHTIHHERSYETNSCNTLQSSQEMIAKSAARHV
ncbi:hypothetical protein GWI33_001661 [Rhynchophorus ferrugineus]|uniref:Uncharacterized protein n=1 Tax=Rhynchophorus ferrugineus TaxID=354439 RepID=A0A834MNC9_RHYFE|nr:hypothetical protein GWI33_001661 [Rhynchophorus ferrugineus]